MKVVFHETKQEKEISPKEMADLLISHKDSHIKFIEQLLEHNHLFSFYDVDGREVRTHARVTITWDWEKI